MTDLKNSQHTPKRSLILSGGGMRVAYQAGVLLALEEAGINFSHWDGTSGGIFNTAMLASGLAPLEIAKRWRTLPLKYFISGKKAKSYLKPFKMKGFADADNIRKKLFPHLGIDLTKISENRNAVATFNVCNFSDKTIEAIPNTEVLEDHLIAGVSLPLFMPALQIGKDWYTDAVWIKDANLLEGVKQGAEEIWLVWTIGNSPGYRPGALHQYVHMIEMSANGALWEEYAQIHWINREIERGNSIYGQKKPIKIQILYSAIPIPLDPDLFFNKINTRELINMGYANAKESLQKVPPEGQKMDIDSTKCKEPVDQLSFRAEFKGTLEWEERRTLLMYHIFFRFSEFPKHKQLDIFSSVNLSFAGLEIPLFDHHTINSKKEDDNFMEIRSRFLFQDKEYHINAILLWSRPLEILLGLGLKQISIRIWNENDKEILKGQLYQSLYERLRSVYFRSWVNFSGEKINLKKKISILKNRTTYEI